MVLSNVKRVTLIAGGGEQFQVPSSYLKLSRMLSEMLDSEMNFGDISNNTMRFIVEYLHHHKGSQTSCVQIEKPLKHGKGYGAFHKVVGDTWESRFMERIASHSLKEVYDIMNSSYKLDIFRLPQLAGAYIAYLIKDQPPRSIANILDIRSVYPLPLYEDSLESSE